MLKAMVRDYRHVTRVVRDKGKEIILGIDYIRMALQSSLCSQ